MNVMQSLLDTDDLKINYEQGTTGTLVVAFAGAGQAIGGLQQQQFQSTFTKLGISHSMVYVIDKNRLWYGGRMVKDILSIIIPLAMSHSDTKTIGNSMGGFGAIYFAGLIKNCSRVLAFVPQYSIASSIVPHEGRVKLYYGGGDASQWHLTHAMQHIADDTEYWLFYGTEEPSDKPHKELFRSHGLKNMKIVTLNNCAHNVARMLIAKGLWSSVILDIFDKAQGEVNLSTLMEVMAE